MRARSGHRPERVSKHIEQSLCPNQLPARPTGKYLAFTCVRLALTGGPEELTEQPFNTPGGNYGFGHDDKASSLDFSAPVGCTFLPSTGLVIGPNRISSMKPYLCRQQKGSSKRFAVNFQPSIHCQVHRQSFTVSQSAIVYHPAQPLCTVQAHDGKLPRSVRGLTVQADGVRLRGKKPRRTVRIFDTPARLPTYPNPPRPPTESDSRIIQTLAIQSFSVAFYTFYT